MALGKGIYSNYTKFDWKGKFKRKNVEMTFPNPISDLCEFDFSIVDSVMKKKYSLN